MSNILKTILLMSIYILIVIVMIICTIITQNEKFLFIIPLGLGIMFLRLSIGVLFEKEDYSKWKEGKGKVLFILDTSHDFDDNGPTGVSPNLVVEFMDEEGKIHRGKSQKFKRVDKYETGDEVEFKYKLHESPMFRKIFGKEPFASIHIFDDELQEYNSKPGAIAIGIFGLFWIILSIIILI